MPHIQVNAASAPAYAPATPRSADRAAEPSLIRSATRARRLGAVLLLGMVACTALIILDAATGHTALVPHSPDSASYLDGVGATLGYTPFLIAMLVMIACYVGVLTVARQLPVRWLIVAIVVVNAIVFAGPVILSQDIFSYIAYGRLGFHYGVNPYTHGPGAASHDAIFPYVGIVWRYVATAYGPLFTLLSYPFGGVSLTAALWGFKLLGVAASLGTVWLVWKCARRMGRDPLLPVVVLGLNPLWVIYDVGGAHNDLLMGFLMMLGVWWTLSERDALGAVGVVAGAAVKASAIAVLPFMVLSRRRVGLVIGTFGAVVVLGAIAYLAFGRHALDVVATLKRQQSLVSSDSFPNEVAHLFGLPGVFPIDRVLIRVGLGVVIAYLAIGVWRGYDWLSAGAWVLLAIAVTTTWLLAWYTLWCLPLAAIARDRRVLWAALAVQALFFAHQLSPLFAPG
jgi:hypothetical protein